MVDVKQMLEHAEQHCNTRGTKLTPRRKQVLHVLLKSEKALSAYELINTCKAEFGETLAAMSMYRILDFLKKENFVHKLHLCNNYIASAHITDRQNKAERQLLICTQCQRVKEISIDKSAIEELQQNMKDAGFQASSPQFELNCVCLNCTNISP